MDYPWGISRQKEACFFAFGNNAKPRRHSIGVPGKKLSKSLGKKLLERVVLARFQIALTWPVYVRKNYGVKTTSTKAANMLK
jgi:hypothetical protein